MGTELIMSKKERDRKAMLEAVKQGYIDLKAASERLGVSYRQVKRLWSRYKRSGDLGLIHQNRGRKSNRAYSAELKSQVLAYYQSKLETFGPTFASEKLTDAGFKIDHETLRRWLVKAGLWHTLPRRYPHRKRRERRPRFGDLVQFDGSFHDWFGNGKKYCLMNMVDDATGRTYSQLFDEETTEAAMRTLIDWIKLYGVPKALYTDKRNVYVLGREASLEESLSNITPLSAFGKSCDNLDITIITAHSPQAKGRVERSNGTYQDRFIKELKFQGITSVEEANKLLRESFCEGLNERFACPPKEKRNGHRKLKKSERLEEIFCWEELRQLQNDWTIRFDNRFYQIAKQRRTSLKPKTKLVIKTYLDGQLDISYKGKKLDFELIPQRSREAKKLKTPKCRGKVITKPEKEKATPHQRYRKWFVKDKEEYERIRDGI